MSRKIEIKTRMQELQKEFASLNAEAKEIDSIEKSAQLRERFKDYAMKVFLYGSAALEDPKFEDVTDEDRETAEFGTNSGLVWSGQFNEGAWLLLKSQADLARAQLILGRLDAARQLLDTKNPPKDRDALLKVLLGE